MNKRLLIPVMLVLFCGSLEAGKPRRATQKKQDIVHAAVSTRCFFTNEYVGLVWQAQLASDRTIVERAGKKFVVMPFDSTCFACESGPTPKNGTTVFSVYDSGTYMPFLLTQSDFEALCQDKEVVVTVSRQSGKRYVLHCIGDGIAIKRASAPAAPAASNTAVVPAVVPDFTSLAVERSEAARAAQAGASAAAASAVVVDTVQEPGRFYGMPIHPTLISREWPHTEIILEVMEKKPSRTNPLIVSCSGALKGALLAYYYSEEDGAIYFEWVKKSDAYLAACAAESTRVSDAICAEAVARVLLLQEIRSFKRSSLRKVPDFKAIVHDMVSRAVEQSEALAQQRTQLQAQQQAIQAARTRAMVVAGAAVAVVTTAAVLYKRGVRVSDVTTAMRSLYANLKKRLGLR
jgi:hypothetical protein